MKWPFLDTLYIIVWIDLQADRLAVEAGSTDFGGSVPLTRAALSPIRCPWWTTIEGEPTRFSGSKTRGLADPVSTIQPIFAVAMESLRLHHTFLVY